CLPCTPGTLSSALPMVMLHAAHVRFSTSSTTSFGATAVARPADNAKRRPVIHLMLIRSLLEEPPDVVRKQQQYCDADGGQPQPAPPASARIGADADPVTPPSRRGAVDSPERPRQAQERRGTEPGP